MLYFDIVGQIRSVLCCDRVMDWQRLTLAKLKLLPSLIAGFSLLVSQERWFRGGLWRTEGYLQRGAGGPGPRHPTKPGVLLPQS